LLLILIDVVVVSEVYYGIDMLMIRWE